MIHVTPNLSEFACRLLSVPPNSATSEQAAKMAQVFWYINQKSKQDKEKSKILNESTSNNMEEKNLDNNDNDDGINEDCDVDKFIDNLNQISAGLIDDLYVFDTNHEGTIPKLVDVFNSK
ncbi:19515_t:CDS:2, partial [Racocetra fulgida]